MKNTVTFIIKIATAFCFSSSALYGMSYLAQEGLLSQPTYHEDICSSTMPSLEEKDNAQEVFASKSPEIKALISYQKALKSLFIEIFTNTATPNLNEIANRVNTEINNPAYQMNNNDDTRWAKVTKNSDKTITYYKNAQAATIVFIMRSVSIAIERIMDGKETCGADAITGIKEFFSLRSNQQALSKIIMKESDAAYSLDAKVRATIKNRLTKTLKLFNKMPEDIRQKSIELIDNKDLHTLLKDAQKHTELGNPIALILWTHLVTHGMDRGLFDRVFKKNPYKEAAEAIKRFEAEDAIWVHDQIKELAAALRKTQT